jgi:NAD(P)H-hydrate epimerase
MPSDSFKTPGVETVPEEIPRLAARRPESHKGDYGRVLLIGGSRGMSGAIALAGMAALRSGAGLVTIATPRSIQDVVASFDPSYMTVGLAETADGKCDEAAAASISELIEGMDAVAVGPGLGRGGSLDRLVARIYSQVRVPLVVDADGLFTLSRLGDQLAQHAGARVLTPHPGEFSRLVGGPRLSLEQAAEKAHELARRWNVLIVLKQHCTEVTDGAGQWTNSTGNAGMATGGCGDVLTGAVTALLGQGLSPWDAARMAVYAHGLAGDLAASDVGQTGMTAVDVVARLPRAWRALESP